MHFDVSRYMTGAALLLAVAAGCGDLADENSMPPVLATFQGTLSLASNMSVPQGDIRLALLWHRNQDQAHTACSEPADTGDAMHVDASRNGRLLLQSIQQAIDVTPQFPASFVLNVREPPPREAFFDYEGVMDAQASFVVYLDGNRNGKLDPRSDGSASPDQVLNATHSDYALLSQAPWSATQPSTYTVHYLTGAVGGLQAGYNIYTGSRWVAADSQIQLELFPTPGLQLELCDRPCTLEDDTPYECPESPADLPAAPSDAQRGYTANVDDGAEAWAWQDAAEGVAFEVRECRKSAPGGGDDSYTFVWSRSYAEGCAKHREMRCRYDATSQAPADWPCESYRAWDDRPLSSARAYSASP